LLESCGTAHYWGHYTEGCSHTAKIIPAQYVKGVTRRTGRTARPCWRRTVAGVSRRYPSEAWHNNRCSNCTAMPERNHGLGGENEAGGAVPASTLLPASGNARGAADWRHWPVDRYGTGRRGRFSRPLQEWSLLCRLARPTPRKFSSHPEAE